MTLLKRIYKFLSTRYCNNISSVLLIFSIAFVEHIITGSFPALKVIGTGIACALFETTLVSLPFCILPKKIDKIYACLLVGIYSLSAITAIISFCIYGKVMVTEVCMLILGTNMQEVDEFFNVYISQFDLWNIAATLIAYITVIITVFVILKKVLKGKERQVFLVCNISFVILACVALYNPTLYASSVPLQIKAITNCFVNLKKYQTSSDIKIDNSKHAPDNIVLIIGESHDRKHSSIYGYDKETNPKLNVRVDNGEIALFRDVVSSATTTIPAFKYMMSTYHDGSPKAWYKHITMPTVAKSAGYNTLWYSNQSKSGFWNNVIAKYAELFDQMYFCQDLHHDKMVNTYDYELIELLEKYQIPDSSKNLVVIHLMGSHPDFESRYPESFNIFSPEDYPNVDNKSRELISQYDNSILYNDYVVDKLIEYFQDRNSIVIYLSDHGLDICRTDPSFAGHAKNTLASTKVSTEIPFWVYLSPSYAASNDSFVDSIKNYTDRQFLTDDLIYSVMDLMGVTFENGDPVKSSSIFSDDFKAKKRIINGYNYDE